MNFLTLLLSKNLKKIAINAGAEDLNNAGGTER